MDSTSEQESKVGCGPEEEKTQLDCLTGSRGPVLAPATRQSDNQGRGAKRFGGLGPHPKPKALLWVLDSGPSLEQPLATQRVATQHLSICQTSPRDCVCHTSSKGTHPHCSSHPMSGEHLLCASGRLLRSYPGSGCRSTSPPRAWAS